MKNVLESILEEIEERVGFRERLVKYEERRGTITDACRNKGALEELDIIARIIRSHMGEVAEDWIPVEERLPEDCEEIVLMQVSGKMAENIWFDNAFELATYVNGEGWILENYPEWENPKVITWQPLPEPYKPKKDISATEHIMSRFMKVE